MTGSIDRTPRPTAVMTREKTMRTMLAGVLAAGLAATTALTGTLAAPTPASASDPTYFPGSDYGKTELRLRESLGGAVMQIRTLGHIFERVGLLPPDDVIRQAAGPVVRLDRLVEYDGQEATSTCTATIVSESYILTNHHCIPGSDKLLEASILLHYEDPDDPDAIRLKVETTPAAADEEMDYAFVRILDPLPEGVEPLRLGVADVSPGGRLVMLHHPAGQPKMMTQFDCRAHEDQTGAEYHLRHVCDTLPGSSGGLLVNAQLQPVALHHTGGLRPGDPGSYNVATRLAAILQTFNELSPAKPSTPSTPLVSAPATQPATSAGPGATQPSLTARPITAPSSSAGAEQPASSPAASPAAGTAGDAGSATSTINKLLQ